jgi:hypothetical protein
MLLVNNLVGAFVPGRPHQAMARVQDATVDGWRRRYFRAIERLRHAGVGTRVDVEAGADEYVALRAGWGPAITWLAPFMAFGMDEVDPAGSAAAIPRPADQGSGGHGGRFARFS